MHECNFCYSDAQFTVVFSKGREISICNHVICFGRLVEIAREENDNEIHSVEEYER